MIRLFLAIFGFLFIVYGIGQIALVIIWYLQISSSLPMELVSQLISDREVIKEPASQVTEGIFVIGMGILLLGVDRIIGLLEQSKNRDSNVNFKKDLGNWPPSV
jgi:hypothetical protein